VSVKPPHNLQAREAFLALCVHLCPRVVGEGEADRRALGALCRDCALNAQLVRASIPADPPHQEPACLHCRMLQGMGEHGLHRQHAHKAWICLAFRVPNASGRLAVLRWAWAPLHRRWGDCTQGNVQVIIRRPIMHRVLSKMALRPPR